MFLFVCFCRTAWVQKIKAASELFIETEKKKREKAYLGVVSFSSLPPLCFFHYVLVFLNNKSFNYLSISAFSEGHGHRETDGQHRGGN